VLVIATVITFHSEDTGIAYTRKIAPVLREYYASIN